MDQQFYDQVFTEKFLKMCEDVSTIKEQISDIKEMKHLVEKHERIYQYGKWTTVPLFAGLHVAMRHLLQKIGL